MKQTTKRLLSMVASLLLLGGAFLVFFNFIRPAYTEVKTLEGEVLVRERFVQDQQDAVKEVQKRISAYNAKTELRNLFSLTLPLVADASGALTQLAGLVQNDTLGAQSFSVADEGGDGGGNTAAPGKSEAVSLTRPLGKLGLQVSFGGSYDNLKSFLEKLESNVRIFDITSVSIAPSGKLNQDLYKVDLKVVTYYQKGK